MPEVRTNLVFALVSHTTPWSKPSRMQPFLSILQSLFPGLCRAITNPDQPTSSTSGRVSSSQPSDSADINLAMGIHQDDPARSPHRILHETRNILKDVVVPQQRDIPEATAKLVKKVIQDTLNCNRAELEVRRLEGSSFRIWVANPPRSKLYSRRKPTKRPSRLSKRESLGLKRRTLALTDS